MSDVVSSSSSRSPATAPIGGAVRCPASRDSSCIQTLADCRHATRSSSPLEAQPGSSASTCTKHRGTAWSQSRRVMIASTPVALHPLSRERDRFIADTTTSVALGHEQRPLVTGKRVASIVLSCVARKNMQGSSLSRRGQLSMPVTWQFSMSPKLRFPLPKDYFGHIQVSASEKLEYHDLVQRRIDALLDDEQHYIHRKTNKLPCLPPADWKYVRAYEDLKVYRRRRRGRSLDDVAEQEDFFEAREAVASGQPSIVATGSIAGTVENLLYGLADTNYEEMRTTTSFLDSGTDSAVLRVFELATRDDPLRFFGLKWMYNSSAPIIEPRDACFLEAMGVERDANDEKYGYLVLHSVDVPECPPFGKVVRGKLYFSCLFRDAAPGIIDVVLRGVFDTTGDLRKLSMPYASVIPYATAAFVGGLTKAIKCAEAKKLTLLARYNAVSGKNRDALNVDEENPKHGLCSVCIRRVGTGVLSCLRLRWCRICGIAVCSKCCVKGKRVFLGMKKPHSSCVCCPNCAQEAGHMTGMQPAVHEYAVVADYFMDSLLSDPQQEDTTVLSSPFVLSAAPKDYNIAFDDWKKHRPGPLLTLAELNSSLNRTTTSSLDESSASVEESSKDSIMELSDDDAEKFRFTASSDEADGYYVFYSPVASNMDSDFGQDKELEQSNSFTYQH